jgi:hypothetical protein
MIRSPLEDEGFPDISRAAQLGRAEVGGSEKLDHGFHNQAGLA